MFVPDGGYVRADNGQSAFTHGIEIGVTRGDGTPAAADRAAAPGIRPVESAAAPPGRLLAHQHRRPPGADHHVEQRVRGHRRHRGRERLDRSAPRRQRAVPDWRGPEQTGAHVSDDVQPHSSERAARGQPVSGWSSGAGVSRPAFAELFSRRPWSQDFSFRKLPVSWPSCKSALSSPGLDLTLVISPTKFVLCAHLCVCGFCP